MKHMATRTQPLQRNVVVNLEYRCRPNAPDYDPEHGWLEGYWTGEIDTWGKLTILVVNDGSAFPVYLFPDEIISAEMVNYGRMQ
jgi:hypothetical protein